MFLRPKTSVFIATSLDGFIARKDGNLDWLNQANACVPAGEDCGFRVFMDSVDGLIMGRNTFALASTFDPWPYAGKRLIVLTRKGGVEIPVALRDTVSTSSEEPATLLDRLAREGWRHVYVDGGATIQSFLATGLIDEITITLIPVLLGEGIPLFGKLEKDLPLKLLETRRFDFGYVQIKYGVGKKS